MRRLPTSNGSVAFSANGQINSIKRKFLIFIEISEINLKSKKIGERNEPMKKVIKTFVFLGLVIAGIWWGRNREWSAPIQHRGVLVSTWNSGLGAIDNTTHDRQKLSFWATVWNDSTQSAYVTDVKINLPDSLREHILIGDTIFSVNQSLDPNATYQVKGELILDTKGMSKQEVVNLGNIQGFVVETKEK